VTKFIWISKPFKIFAVQVESRKVEIAGSDACFFDFRDDFLVDVFDRPISVIDEGGREIIVLPDVTIIVT